MVRYVIQPLTECYVTGWETGGLKDAVQPMQEEVRCYQFLLAFLTPISQTFPELLEWVGTPWAIALEYILAMIDKDNFMGKQVAISKIETINMIERVMTCHQSGTRKVWHMASMKAAGLWKSYLEAGYPTFSKEFLKRGLRVDVGSLGVGRDGQLALAASVAIRYHYGINAANVSVFHLSAREIY